MSAWRVRALVAVLTAHPDLDATWLFGSQATGHARPESDVDVAVLFRDTLSDMEATLLRGRLMDELVPVVGRRVDVVDVERIPPITFALVMRQAKLLTERDRPHRLDALCRQYALWHDMQPHYALQRQSTRDHYFGTRLR